MLERAQRLPQWCQQQAMHQGKLASALVALCLHQVGRLVAAQQAASALGRVQQQEVATQHSIRPARQASASVQPQQLVAAQQQLAVPLRQASALETVLQEPQLQQLQGKQHLRAALPVSAMAPAQQEQEAVRQASALARVRQQVQAQPQVAGFQLQEGVHQASALAAMQQGGA